MIKRAPAEKYSGMLVPFTTKLDVVELEMVPLLLIRLLMLKVFPFNPIGPLVKRSVPDTVYVEPEPDKVTPPLLLMVRLFIVAGSPVPDEVREEPL